MVKKDKIGSSHYSKVLDRMVIITEGPTDDYYKLIGLESVIEPIKKEVEPKKEKAKLKNFDKDNEGAK